MKMFNQKTLDEAYPIIHKLAKNRSCNGGFAYYEPSDVYQEIWGMCLDAMNRYDPDTGPIENFLVIHVTNRLKNIKRDKYFRPGFDIVSSGLARTRMDLVNALPLSVDEITGDCPVWCSTPQGVDPADNMSCDETIEYVTNRLSGSLKEAFELLINNNRIRSVLRNEVQQKVAEILADRDKHVEN